MNQLVIMKDRQAVTSTTNISNDFEKEHYDVIKSVEKIKEDIGTFTDMFFETVEPDSYNRDRKVYLMNRDGFTLLAMGFNGKKAMEFKLKYIKAFNEMEEELKPSNSMELALESALKHEKDINSIKKDVSLLKGTMRVSSLEQQELRDTVNRTVVRELGGKESPAYKNISRVAFSSFWKEFKQYFHVPRYGDLPTAKFKDGLSFAENWKPNTPLQMDINSYNDQSQLL